MLVHTHSSQVRNITNTSHNSTSSSRPIQANDRGQEREGFKDKANSRSVQGQGQSKLGVSASLRLLNSNDVNPVHLAMIFISKAEDHSVVHHKA